MSTMNQWGDGVDESIGDEIYDALEDKVKDKAKDLSGKALDKSVEVLDKVTDRIGPVKQIKDKIKEKLSNNPITRAKAAVKKLRDKLNKAAKNMAKEGIQAVGRAAVSAAKSAGSAVSSFVAAHPVVAIVIFVVLLIIMCLMNESDSNSNNNNSQNNDTLFDNPAYVDLDSMTDDDLVIILMDDCANQQYDPINGMIDSDKEERAKLVYNVFHSYGLNNVSIAGMLANLDIESIGIDPSAVEGIFAEQGVLGPKKAEALLSLTDYTEDTLFSVYKAQGKSIDKDEYKTTDSSGRDVYYCGLGLPQWTGENAKKMLSAAETLHVNWYDMNFQLGYMLSDRMYRPGFFAGWKDNQEDDYSFDEDSYTRTDYATDEAYNSAINAGKTAAYNAAVESAKTSAVYFAYNYEGNESNDGDRKNKAKEWYDIISGWDDDDVDNTYADSIGELATNLGGIVDFINIENLQYRCLNGNIFDNSSLAAAAVSLAWPTQDLSYNNGKNLYQTVLKTIWPATCLYKSCDHTVACAVRWSGTDDLYPLEGTPDQIRYLEASPKWERIGTSDAISMDNLLPGDVFILNGHTFLYVGESAVQSAYGDEANYGSDSVSGSKNERSPACDLSATSLILQRSGYDWDGHGVYTIYRCIDPDNSSTYSSIGYGVTN